MLRRFFNSVVLAICVHILAWILTVLTILNTDATMVTFLTSVTLGVGYFTFDTIKDGDSDWRFKFGLTALTLILGYMTWFAWQVAFFV